MLPEPMIVNHGVDTLVLNAYCTQAGQPVKRELPEELAVQLDAWKLLAQADSEPYITPWLFDAAPLLMHPNGEGRGQWQWMLKNRAITLLLSRGKWNGVASVRFSSEYLWSCDDLLDAVVACNAFLYDLFHDEMYLQVSQVDLCADVAYWLDITTLDRRLNFVSRSRKRGEHHAPDGSPSLEIPDGLSLQDFSCGLEQTGFTFSKRGPMSCRIYDKTHELRDSGKLWFVPLWQANGYKETGEKQLDRVWRVEFPIKREALHTLKGQDANGQDFWGIEGAYDLPVFLPLLWTYATGHVQPGEDGLADGWLRCVVPSDDRNRARWPTHPVWKLVQAAYSEPNARPEHFGKLIRKHHEEHNIEKGLEAIMGYSSSLSAWVGGDLARPGVDLSTFLHWLSINGLDLYERRQKDFAQEVQRKCATFGK